MSKDVLELEKVPTSKHKYLGIEIEFVTPFEYEKVMDLLVASDLSNYCHLGSDGSIEEVIYTGNKVRREMFDNIGSLVGHELVDEELCGEGFELRVLCTEVELVSVMKRVGTVLKQCKAQVNESCGLHVHLDMRNRDFVKSAKHLLLKQNEMFNMVPTHRKYNSYCAFNDLTPSGVKKRLRLNKTVNTAGLGRSAVNICAYNVHKTIEIRLHEGTTNWVEIVNWSKYLIAVCDKKKQSKGVKEYAKKRIKTFGAKAS